MSAFKPTFDLITRIAMGTSVALFSMNLFAMPLSKCAHSARKVGLNQTAETETRRPRIKRKDQLIEIAQALYRVDPALLNEAALLSNHPVKNEIIRRIVGDLFPNLQSMMLSAASSFGGYRSWMIRASDSAGPSSFDYQQIPQTEYQITKEMIEYKLQAIENEGNNDNHLRSFGSNLLARPTLLTQGTALPKGFADKDLPNLADAHVKAMMFFFHNYYRALGTVRVDLSAHYPKPVVAQKPASNSTAKPKTKGLQERLSDLVLLRKSNQPKDPDEAPPENEHLRLPAEEPEPVLVH